MQKRWLAALFLVFLYVSFTFAQNVRKQNEAQWEFLQVSAVRTCNLYGFQKDCRRYEYIASGEFFDAQDSLVWIKESGWELVGVSTSENFHALYFKRLYNKARTENEIVWLKKEFEKESPKPAASSLIDLDTIENKQKLDAFNQSEVSRMRTALEQISGLPIKIISVASEAVSVRNPRAGAEIVLDATPVLLKDGNRYRSSDADKYYQDAVKLILEKIQVMSSYSGESNAQNISNGRYKPVEIGKFGLNTYNITIKLSVIVNYNNKQNIVAQNWIYGRWQNKPQ